jgi:hypothetical protein
LIAGITNLENQFQGRLDISLTVDGQKISGEGVRAKLMHGNCAGHSIKLAAAGKLLGLAEGLEDALSVMQLYEIPCWAVCGTAGMKKVKLPDIVKEVRLYADNDAPGRTAAEESAARFRKMGKHVEILYPPDESKDFNEYLIKQKTARVGAA